MRSWPRRTRSASALNVQDCHTACASFTGSLTLLESCFAPAIARLLPRSPLATYLDYPSTSYQDSSFVPSPSTQERLRQKKEADAVLGERDVLGSQLVRRNDELALLYEKTRLQVWGCGRLSLQGS